MGQSAAVASAPSMAAVDQQLLLFDLRCLMKCQEPLPSDTNEPKTDMVTTVHQGSKRQLRNLNG